VKRCAHWPSLEPSARSSIPPRVRARARAGGQPLRPGPLPPARGQPGSSCACPARRCAAALLDCCPLHTAHCTLHAQLVVADPASPHGRTSVTPSLLRTRPTFAASAHRSVIYRRPCTCANSSALRASLPTTATPLPAARSVELLVHRDVGPSLQCLSLSQPPRTTACQRHPAPLPPQSQTPHNHRPARQPPRPCPHQHATAVPRAPLRPRINARRKTCSSHRPKRARRRRRDLAQESERTQTCSTPNLRLPWPATRVRA
jgi:hypothetical protein